MLDTVTFFSIWYWALAIALWSEIGASAYGVTGRLMRDAARGDAEAAELVDRLARRSAARIAHGWEKRGALQVGGASALIAGLATLAFGVTTIHDPSNDTAAIFSAAG